MEVVAAIVLAADQVLRHHLRVVLVEQKVLAAPVVRVVVQQRVVRAVLVVWVARVAPAAQRQHLGGKCCQPLRLQRSLFPR